MLDQSYFHTAQFSSIEHKKRFIDYNFFSCENRQKLSLSTYRNMMILQILSHNHASTISGYRVTTFFVNFTPQKHIFPKGSNSPKTNFF